MSKHYTHPKLRWPLDYRVEKYQGQEIIILTDPKGISGEPLILQAILAPIIACLDGRQSTEEIVEKFSPQGLSRELLEQLIETLDKAYMLDTPIFKEKEKQILERFAQEKIRSSSSLAPYYSKEALLTDLDSYIDYPSEEQSSAQMLGVIAPHIDYRRGGPSYGLTYGTMAAQEHDLYLVMGTGHQYSERLFHLTKKDFEVPTGLLKTEKNFIEKLGTLHGKERSFQDEYLHRKEHSIELQLPFLKRVKEANNHKDFQIAPILAGSFHHMLVDQKMPKEYEEYESFIQSLLEITREYLNADKKICFISSVDMAHVGAAFGDREKLSPELMQEIERQDRVYLDAIKTQNKEMLFYHMASDRNKRKVCGFPTIYTMIDLFDRLELKYESHLFDYRQAVDYENECAVTFAGMGLYLKN